ncbi:NAD(P)/FAD-dependent oxidoreductase [Candidatus Woesearchaeota archaeon]|nr:NAD(P)/FAD-dependent oxidoreductase [Candidatus Woesearchaeota archaeon]
MQQYDTIIIGMGPAGLSTAIYTSRAKLKTLVLGAKEKSQLWKAHSIENYFGIDSVQGKDLLETGIKQAKRFGSEIIEAEVVNIKQKEKEFIVKIASGKEFHTKTIVFATGIPIKLSGIKNEEKFTGKGVHYCVVCDGFFYKDKKVAVIGNANYAAEQAIELLTYTKDVTIISNGKEFQFDKKYKDALDKNKINLIPNKIISFEGEKKLEKLKTTTGELEFDGVYIGIGSAGAGSFAKKFGIETKGDAIVTDKEGKTNMKGIYAAGICTGIVSQAASSVGEGCVAAMSVIKQLKEKEMYVDYGSKNS